MASINDDQWGVFKDATPKAADPWGAFKDAAPPDKYRQEAMAERERILARGGSLPEGYTRRLEQGLGMNWTDEAMSVAMTPFETLNRGIKHGEWSPYEAYRYARAREQVAMEKARENTGKLGTAAEVVGGLATGGRAVLGSALPAAGNATIRAAPTFAERAGRFGTNALKGAGVGAVGGAGEGGDEFDLGERGLNAGVGGVIGAGVGAALPPVLSAVGAAARPITNQLRRFASRSETAPVSNVDDVALGQVASSFERSGRTGEQVAREVADANASGQPLILAEGLGLEGQRKLAGIAKTPGAARQWIDEDLGARDLGRSLRAQDAVETGLGIPRGQTAEGAQQALTQEARAASRPYYQAAEAVQPVWTPRLQQFFEHPDFNRALREGFHAERGRALVNNQPFNPRDYAITNFNEAGDPIMSAVPNMRTIHLMKLGIDRMINKHRNPLTGRVDTNDPTVQTLNDLQRAFLREVDSLNPMYARARAEYAGPAQVRSAVERGQDMPMSGRFEDTIPRFRAQSAAEQQGTRIGYADRVASQLQKGTETGPLPSILRTPKGRAELDAMSLHQGPRQPMPRNPMARPSDPDRYFPDPMRRALDREQTMRQTFTMARGGAQTAENLADMADNLPPPVDVVGVGGNLLAGNWMGAARGLAPAAGRAMRGESEAQRNAMTRILMERDPNEIAGVLQRIADLQARRRAASTARVGAAASVGANTGTSPLAARVRRRYRNAP